MLLSISARVRDRKVLTWHIPGEPQAFEQHQVEHNYPFADTHFPGADIVWMKSDRGTRKGMYGWFWNFDTLERRDYYFPQPEAPWPNAEPIFAKWGEEVGTGGFETENAGQGDYVLVGRETAAGMPWINMLGIHHIRVKAGQGAAFEHFVETKWNPHGHMAGWWALIYKADRGERVGEYILVHALEPGLLRDIYFPEGEGLSEAGQAAMRPLGGLWEELQSYLVAPAEGEAEWSDFFVIR